MSAAICEGASRRSASSEGDKVVWILVIVLAGIVGALIYLFARRGPRRRALG